MNSLRYFFWAVDVGFLTYWLVTLLGIIPDAYLFKDYHDPILMAWNGSFLPLDVAISASGLASLHAWRRANPMWQPLAIVSLVLTSCSGLQAVAFWTLRGDFDPIWWGLNLFLLAYPFFYLPRLMAHPIKAVANTEGSDL